MAICNIISHGFIEFLSAPIMPYNDMIRWEATQINVNQEAIVNIKF